MRDLRAASASLGLALIATQFAAMGLLMQPAGGPLRGAADVVASAALVGTLALAATTRTRRIALAATCSALAVLQLVVYRFYHAPLDAQVLASALFSIHDVRPVVLRTMPALVLTAAVLAAMQTALLAFFHRTQRAVGAPLPARAAIVGAALAVAAGLLGNPARHATPEVRAVHALTALRVPAQKVQSAQVSLPPLLSERRVLPDVLFVLGESIRAADYRGAGPEPTAPETFALTSGRTDLAELRAVSSYTALSVSAVLTGRGQTGPRAPILAAPSLFDFAHAARDGRGERPTVAYVSSQSETVFETDGVRGAVDRFVTIETLRGRDVEDDADYADLPLDRELVDRYEKTLADLPSPSVTMLHFVGTHAPYFVDRDRAPFQPYDHSVAWSGMPRLHNAYLDAIVANDRSLARALRAFFAHEGDRPWLVVFTSDHGEAFGESGAIHHGQNLFDEQVHVPAFVLASPGLLSSAEQAALSDHAGRFVTHLDLLPTVLDALGLWDNSAVAPYRAELPGRSLLRPFAPRPPLPVTNCTPMFQCPVSTWGLYDGDRKLLSRTYDNAWRCFAVGGGLERQVDGVDPRCDALRDTSRGLFPLLPNGAPNR